jgi:glycosyltransferase involved in cell wall biosynthesis
MVVHAPYPLAETRVEREAHAAQAAGWDVDVVAMREPHEVETETLDDGIRVVRVPVRRVRGAGALHVAREYLAFTLLAARTVARLDRDARYGVVQVHNPPDFLLAAALVPRLRGARTILDIHDLAPELFALRFGGRSGSGPLLAALSLVERVALRLADAVVTVHEPYRRLLLERGVPPEKIVVALNSPDESLLPATEAQRTDGPFRVVYHGSVIEHYGLITLVDAIAALGDDVPELVVEIYGTGDALPAVKGRVDSHGLADRFRFSDRFVENREILHLVQGADVEVVANLAVERNKAALPTKLFEYAALEIPVVSSDLPAVREYFSGDEVRFFTPGDAAELARAIRELASDRAAAAAQADRARARYEQYRWGRQSADYVGLLERLAG